METVTKSVTKSASRLEKVLRSGDFAVTGELVPPKSANPEVVREKARLLRGLVDAVNITDCQTAIVRMSSIGAGLLTQAEGVEPIIQLTCRDRNRIAMQSDILGAAAFGLKNLLCLTGDHQKFGNHPGAKGVFDMDSIQLLGVMKNLRDEKKFQCGEVIKDHEPRFFLGCAANPFAGPNEPARAARLAKKVASGADFVQTQIIYNVERFAKFMAAVRELGLDQQVFILAGVTPPRSLGMARYMKNFVPGLDVTDEVLKRMSGAKDKEEEGIKICVEIINQCREIKGVAGVHIMAIEWEAAVAEIVKRAGLADRLADRPGLEPDLEAEKVPIPAPIIERLTVGQPAAVDKPVTATLEVAKTIDFQSAAEAAETAETTEAAQFAQAGEAAAAELAAARREAAKIIAAARAEAAAIGVQAAVPVPASVPASVPAQAPTVAVAEITDSAQIHAQSAADAADAGEDEMNERERQMALNSVRRGLAALKKTFGLSDDQFDAMAQFAGAEAILKREPLIGTGTSVAVIPTQPEALTVPVSAEPTPAAASPDPVVSKAAKAQTPGEAQKAAEIKAQEEAKAQEETKAQMEVQAQAEAKAAAAVRKKAAAQAPAAKESKKLADAQDQAPAATKVAEKTAKVVEVPAQPEVKTTTSVAPVAVLAGGELAGEKISLAKRASKISTTDYIQNYSGAICEVSLGNAPDGVTVGGINALPFHLFEGEMKHQPLIAMDVLDVLPEEWPTSLSRHFAEVMNNAVTWAQKCVQDYQAEAICLSLVSTDPNGLNRSAADAAKIAAAVVKAIEVPIIIWGCGNNEKDTETLREITAIIGDRKVCLAPLEDKNYRSLGATAMAFQHPMVASSPIDVNLAKQLNILLENLGVPLNTILIDPSVGALGYGIEYTYSVMERIRLAALTQEDVKLQVPFICNLGREVWKTKECRLPSDEMLGDQETRGVLMEAITATCMLMAGGEVLIMRHPRAIALTKTLIKGLMA